MVCFVVVIDRFVEDMYSLDPAELELWVLASVYSGLIGKKCRVHITHRVSSTSALTTFIPLGAASLPHQQQ